ncbi:MAG TPA: hypothetical protein VK765_02250 [Solirubrobacteraceae bacterium]|jgi:hypothetical protein|nr:hypothetical protein [Solirubrobacteraceae bacterium]
MATDTAIEAPSAAEQPTVVQPAVKAPDAKADKKGKKGKDEKQGKGKAAVADADGPSVAAHPRAARAVARAKSWGGLAGFVLAGYMSLPTNTVADAMLRALIAGIACYVAVWAAAVFLWRRLVMLELKGREQQLMEAMKPAARRELPAPSGPERGAPRSA